MDHHVTSLAEQLEKSCPPRTEVETALLESFAQVFGMSLTFAADVGILSK